MKLSRLFLVGGAVAVVMIAGLFFGTHALARPLAPVAVRLHQTLSFLGGFFARRDLADENEHLRQLLTQAQGAVAREDELQKENDFLHAAMGLAASERHPVIGAVFSYLRDGGVRQMVANRGTRDGVAKGDVVLTADGAMAGVVEEVGERSAIICSFGDPSLEVTGRIVGTDVSGLVRVDARQGLLLDLVKKDEVVTEGQVIATSGNDQFPAGLVIGTVRSVDNESATLFKVVRVTPVVAEDFDGRVLIIKP